jgi:hypothetical protein
MAIDPLLKAILGILGFAVVGLAFGALARLLAQRSGLAAGGRIGRAIAAALGVTSEGRTAAVAGGVEGALFLAVVGFLVAVLGGLDILLATLAGLAALAVGGVFFGCVGYLLVLRKNRALAVLGAALAAAALALVFTESNALAVLAGALAGLLVAGIRGLRTEDASRESLLAEGPSLPVPPSKNC